MSARVLGMIDKVVRMAAMAVPVVHGGVLVMRSYNSLKALRRSVGSTMVLVLESNWAVAVCMLPLVVTACDFESLWGTDMQADGHGAVVLGAAQAGKRTIAKRDAGKWLREMSVGLPLVSAQPAGVGCVDTSRTAWGCLAWRRRR